MADLNGDGRLDLLSGSWPGELFYFRGGSDRSFDPPVKLKYKTGKTINIGGGKRDNAGEYLLIAGDAQFEQKDGKTFILYDGERIEVPKGKQAGITGTASAVHAFDWDGDGDLDLIVGEIAGNVYLVPNEGTPREYAFGKEEHLQADGKPIRVQGDAGPFVADWDGDGKHDLIVGAGDGAVTVFRNLGTAKEPKLAAGEILVPPPPSPWENPPKEARRGVRTKVCVADWNGDGRLDLLMGDYTMQKPDLPEPTPEQKVEHDKLRKKQDAVMVRYRELSQKIFGPFAVKDEEERKKLQKEQTAVLQEMSELRAKLPKESESHGWVWLFLRKPAEAKAAGG